MKVTAWQLVYFLCHTPSHLPDTRLQYRNWLVALAYWLPASTRGLNGRQYMLLQSTDQKVEAGWETLSVSTRSNWSYPPNKCWERNRRGEGRIGVRRRVSTTFDARYHSLNAATAADTAASRKVHECA